jgi:hypothetical protein
VADQAFAFLLAVLAVYRLAILFTLDDGPFDLFARMRDEVGQDGWVGRGLHCPGCVGFWIALAAACAVPGVSLASLGLWWMAIAGGAFWLTKAVRHD